MLTLINSFLQLSRISFWNINYATVYFKAALNLRYLLYVLLTSQPLHVCSLYAFLCLRKLAFTSLPKIFTVPVGKPNRLTELQLSFQESLLGHRQIISGIRRLWGVSEVWIVPSWLSYFQGRINFITIFFLLISPLECNLSWDAK